MEESFEDYLNRLKDRRDEDEYKYTNEDFELYKVNIVLKSLSEVSIQCFIILSMSRFDLLSLINHYFLFSNLRILIECFCNVS